MSSIKYPRDWLGEESEGLVVNYVELTSLCAANGIKSGEVSYIAEQMRLVAMRSIHEIVKSREQNENL